MKITLSYLPEEELEASAVVEALRQRHTGARVHKSEAKPPYKLLYLTIKRPGKPLAATDKA